MKRTGPGWIIGALLLALSLALAACGGDSGGNNGGVTPPTSSVTLSGTMNLSGGAAPLSVSLGTSQRMLSNDPLAYTLYCVTFTDPPQSGTGSFDAGGNYSVTIPDAAGLSVGCFITETATAQVAATVTFTLSAGETSGGASFSGGSHTVTIAFNADTGEATADVAATATAPAAGSGALTPSNLVGEWAMTCAPPDGTPAGQSAWEACLQFVPPRVFVDVLTANVNRDGNIGNGYEATAYAMAVWRSLHVYEAASFGSTPTHEGMATDAIPASEVDLASLTSLYTSGDPTNGALGGFLGFTSQTGWGWDSTNGYFTMSGTNVLAALTAVGVGYDQTFDDGMGGSCINASPDLATVQGRQCLLSYLEYLKRQSEAVVPFTATAVADHPALYIPRLHDNAWNAFVGQTDGAFTGASAVPFKEVVGSPDIAGRYSVLDLTLSGDAMIANEHESHSGTKYSDGVTPCEWYHSTTITFTRQAGSTTNLVGWFVSAEGNDCESTPRSSIATFKVIFSPLNTTPTMALNDLNGNYISGCEIHADGSGRPTYRSTTLSVTTGGVATVREYDFGANGCGGPVESATESLATISLLEDRPTAWGNTPAALAAITLTGMVVTPYSDATAAQWATDTAYGSGSWTAGTPSAELVSAGSVTNYDGTTGSASAYDLFYVDASGRLYVGINESRNAYGVPTDVKPAFAPVAASTVNAAALNGRTFGTFCMQYSRTEYNALSRSQGFAFTATTITMTETYHATADCDYSQRTVEEVQVLAMAPDAVSQPLTTRGFGSPVSISTGGGGYSHTVAVFDATAAGIMTTDTAFNQTTWTANAPPVEVGTVQYDGSNPGPSTFKVSAIDAGGGYLFLVTPDAPTTYVAPTNADGYGLVVRDNQPALEITTPLTVADLEGVWVDSCRVDGSNSRYQVLTFDNLGNASSTEYAFTGSTECKGTPVVTSGNVSVTIGASPGTLGGFGPVVQASTNQSDCGLVQLRGGLLFAEFNKIVGTSCAPSDYPVTIVSPPLERVESPLVSTSLPVAAFSSCRNRGGGSVDELEFLRVFGDAVLSRRVTLNSTDGQCGGNITAAEFWGGQFTYTGTVVTTERGPATRANVVNPFTGESMGTILHLEQSHFFVGDDSGVVPPAYPTSLSDDSYERRF